MQIYYESHRDNMRLPVAWYDHINMCLPHFHAGIELVHVLEGSMEATINGHTHTVRAGEMLVNNCYSVHAYSAADCVSIVAIIPLSVVPSIQKLLTANRFERLIIQDDSRRSLEFFMRMLAENPDNEILLKGISYAVLGYLSDRIPLTSANTTDPADVICGILNYLNEHYRERLTVDQVAAHFGYSRSRFSHLFKNTVGYSLPQYLNMLRCRSVCESMLATDKPVVELAIDAGFNNPHTFYTAFKSYYHMTPREYVSQRRKQLP